jgi:microcystin-dependent protein
MEAFVGQLLLVPYNFAPLGWMFCQGQLVSIAEYSALYNLIGTTFGGDGQNTFALPNLNGRTVLGMGTAVTGTNYPIGQVGGVESVTISPTTMPQHTHPLSAAGQTGNYTHPAGSLLGDGQNIYHSGTPHATVQLNAASIGPLGGSQPHENRQPYLTFNWIISMNGIYPSQ